MIKKIWVSSIEEYNKYVHWLKEDVEIDVYNEGKSDIQPLDYVSMSLQTVIIGQKIDLQKEFDGLLISVTKEVTYNYDYYFLKSAISESRNENVVNIVSGSSYSLFGFNSKYLEGSVNFGLSSQDLYYSIRGVHKAIELNEKIRNIVLMTGPYYFYSDLSKSKDAVELSRVVKVYKPLFDDIHNATLLETKISFLYDSCIWNINRILDVFIKSEYEKGYFHNERPRENFQTRTWTRNCNWIDLTEEERIEAGKRRAESHNKSMKYDASLIENVSIFNEFVKYCNEKQINIIMIITPASKYYRDVLDVEFREKYYEVLELCEGEVHLLDLYEDDNFGIMDFNDADHLSESGAEKMTNIVSNLLVSL